MYNRILRLKKFIVPPHEMVSDDFKILFIVIPPPARVCWRARERGVAAVVKGAGRNERAAEINSYAIQIKMSIFGRG